MARSDSQRVLVALRAFADLLDVALPSFEAKKQIVDRRTEAGRALHAERGGGDWFEVRVTVDRWPYEELAHVEVEATDVAHAKARALLDFLCGQYGGE